MALLAPGPIVMAFASAASRDRSTASVDDGVEAHQLGRAQRVGPCSRDRSMMSCTSSASRPASCLHPAGEPAHCLRVVRGVHQRLGEQRDGPDRGLELVADVRDEVAAYGVDPVLLGAVLDQEQDMVEPSGATRACTMMVPRRAGRGAAPAPPLGSRRRGALAVELEQVWCDQAVVATRPNA